MVMTPAYLAAGEPLLRTAGVALCGLIPAAYVAWATAPFVASVHLHLPPYARHSRAILERFARTAPPNTRLDVTTMSLIGKPRVSAFTLSDLRPATATATATAIIGWDNMGLRRRLGTVNYLRDTAIVDRKRKWWRFRAVGGFNIQEHPDVRQRDRNLKTAWVWGVVREGIERRAKGVVGKL
ncbi:hypothetical protein BT67DRAFT_385591 [Trichocladium antarcticum]|uniref:Uncharacterized protein n=1 Tax=Trichocladium antarcticum TaxID=1450529 RepID=A0AAN6UG52_9PEZI|nr:hypothetical protein BT67DRAFT_385591 [Trichocladium antarcticum]